MLWATGFVLAGYLAGDSWRSVEQIAGRAGVVLLLLVALAGAVALTAKWVGRHQDRLRAVMAEQLERPKVAAVWGRYQRQLTFLGRRFQPGGAFGLSLTASLVALVAAGWMLGAIVQDVVVGRGSARFDRPVMNWFAGHREPWLTKIMWVVTAFGSSAVLIPIGLAVGVWFWWRRGAPRPFLLLFAAYGGSELLSETVRALTRRPRPPRHLAAGHFAGFAFPSGHATHSVAVYGMLAVVLAGTTPLWRRKVAVWTGAFSVATTIGISRLYLGAHWLTDVLGGFALGNLWLFVVVVAARIIPGRRSAPAAPLNAPR